MVDDVEAAISTLQRLKPWASRWRSDDFGTGYSSLSYLKRFFPHRLRQRSTGPSSGPREETSTAKIVRSVIRLAAAIGIGAVAEGVETEDQLERLRDLQCPLVQASCWPGPSDRPRSRPCSICESGPRLTLPVRLG